MLLSRLACLTLLAALTTAPHTNRPASHPAAALAVTGSCRQPTTFLKRSTKATRARITVTYQDADIRDVLAAFATFAGRTIIVGHEVQGMITTEVRDQRWDTALEDILASKQLTGSEDQYGIITVDACEQK